MGEHNNLGGLSRVAEQLDVRIQREKATLDSHRVLDSEARMNARDAAIDIVRLRVLIRDLSTTTSEQDAAGRANLITLRTRLDTLAALVDRGFKGQQ